MEKTESENTGIIKRTAVFASKIAKYAGECNAISVLFNAVMCSDKNEKKNIRTILADALIASERCSACNGGLCKFLNKESYS